MPLTQYMQKQILDYICGGAAATRPASRFISFASGTPTEAGASDAPINARASLDIAAASGTPSSATNRSARSNATATANCTVFGWNMYDSAVGGTRLAYGTMTATFTVTNLGSVIMSAGRLIITIG